MESLLTCVTTAVRDHVRVMLGARASIQSSVDLAGSRLTFPQHEQPSSAAPMAARANVALLGPAAQCWQLQRGGTGGARAG